MAFYSFKINFGTTDSEETQLQGVRKQVLETYSTGRFSSFRKDAANFAGTGIGNSGTIQQVYFRWQGALDSIRFAKYHQKCFYK
jgi:primase-polymerase (primpol)-like protein